MFSPAKRSVGHDENTMHKSPRGESVLCILKRFSKATDKRRFLSHKNALTVNVQSANDLTSQSLNEDEINFVGYSPELVSLMTAGGRSKRWAFCLTPSIGEASGNANCPGYPGNSPKVDRPASTLYIFMDPNCDISKLSTETEVTMYVATEEEIRQHHGGNDFLRSISAT